MKNLFMTGITGFVGGEVIKRYLDRAPDLHIVAMIRAVDEDRLAKRIGKLLKAHFGDRADAVRDRFTFVKGDLLKEGLGVTEADRDLISTKCDAVLHCAASVDFGATLEFSREYNVDGTRRVLELCERMGDRLERLDYISTAYVSGNRSDVCLEDELSNRGLGWANFYEQSKFESEALVRSFREQGHPVSIYRPSTVVGDSNTGETPNFNVLYWPLRVFARGWWNLMIGYETTPVDVVPVNYVADCIVNLSLKGASTVGRTYHLAAGPDKICHIKDLATHASKWFDQPYPTFVTPEDFHENIRPQMDAEATPALRMLISQGKVYMPYFVRSPLFDCSNVLADLEGTGTEPCMPISEYFDTLFAYCVETDWGRKAPKKAVGGEGAETDPLEGLDPDLSKPGV